MAMTRKAELGPGRGKGESEFVSVVVAGEGVAGAAEAMAAAEARRVVVVNFMKLEVVKFGVEDLEVVVVMCDELMILSIKAGVPPLISPMPPCSPYP
jgi:hypothetical protein